MSYKRGFDYVVCPQCGSHVLTDGLVLDHYWGSLGFDRVGVEFRCDHDPCGAHFVETVFQPGFVDTSKSGLWQSDSCTGTGERKYARPTCNPEGTMRIGPQCTAADAERAAR